MRMFFFISAVGFAYKLLTVCVLTSWILTIWFVRSLGIGTVLIDFFDNIFENILGLKAFCCRFRQGAILWMLGLGGQGLGVGGVPQPFGQRLLHPFLASFRQHTKNKAFYTLNSIRRLFFKSFCGLALNFRRNARVRVARNLNVRERNVRVRIVKILNVVPHQMGRRVRILSR